MIEAIFEILIECLIRLARFIAKNFRAVFGLCVGAGAGLAFGLSLAKYGGVDGWTILMFIVIGAVVIAPAIIGFLNGLSSKQ